MMARSLEVLTVGYERRQPEEMLALLAGARVTRLLDVRLRPASRRPGLSKTSLGNLCESFGIDYLHDRRLGTPAEQLRALRETGIYDWDAFRGYIDTQPEALAEAALLAEDGRTALLCYELDPSTCHRSIVAEYLSRLGSFRVRHL